MKYHRLLPGLLILVSPLLFCPFIGEAQPPVKTDKKVFIALAHTYADFKTKKNTGRVTILGSYQNGKYQVEACDVDDTTHLTTDCERILKANRDFTVYYKGTPFAHTRVTKVTSEPFDCSTLVSGECNFKPQKDAYEAELKSNTEYHDKYHLGEVDGVSNGFIAISGKRDIQETDQKAVQEVNLSKNQLRQLRDIVNERIETETGRKVVDSMIQLKDIYKMDLNNDSIPEYITSAVCEDTDSRFSCMIFFHIWNSKVSPFHVEYDDVGADAWGDGFNFVDAIDIDGDGIKEIIVEVTGYETTGYIIYDYKDEKIGVVLEDDAMYGC